MAFLAAKVGLVNLTRHMAVAHATEGVRVNCVCPGVVRTALTEQWLSDPIAYERACAWHPMTRIGTVDEIVAAILFLCCEESSFVTGVILPVGGGYVAAGRGRS
jgi:NAD(P)-dependent dehydrogenase (short-subunit alcohol dehydrogenase family)